MAYPTVSAMLTVVAPASMTARSSWNRYSGLVRVASMGENSTSEQYFLALATIEMACSITSSRFFLSWCMMWMSELDRNTWMRGFSASCMASHAASTSSGTARASDAMMVPLTSLAMVLTRLEVARA